MKGCEEGAAPYCGRRIWGILAVSGAVSGGEGVQGMQKVEDGGALVYYTYDALSDGEFVGGAEGVSDFERLLLG